MAKHIKEIDVYTGNPKPFAQKILKYLRKLVHQACPEIEECIKWKFPHFSYHGLLCSMAAFSEHCAFGFWKGAIMSDPHSDFGQRESSSNGAFRALDQLKGCPKRCRSFSLP